MFHDVISKTLFLIFLFKRWKWNKL